MSLAYTVNSNTVTITGLGAYDLNANGGVLNVPATIDGYPVVAIGAYAFFYNWDINSVILPENLTTIMYSAFSYCNYLTNITMPTTLVTISSFAFVNCSSITNITLSNTRLTSIGQAAFVHCYSLTTISLPSTITSIYMYAFQSCQNLQHIILPSTLTTLGEGVFINCSSLQVVTFAGTYQSGFDTNAFYNLYSTKINTASDITAWPNYDSGLSGSTYFNGQVVTGPPSAPSAASPQVLLPADAILSNLVATPIPGATLHWYSTDTTDTELAPTTIVSSRSYYVSQSQDYLESERTLVSVIILTRPIATYSQELFLGAIVSNLFAIYTEGATLQWYTTDVSGTALAPDTTVTNGHYYVSQLLDGVESDRTQINVTIVTSQGCNSNSVSENIIYTNSTCQSGDVQNCSPATCGSGVLQNPNAQLTGKLRSRLLTTALTYSDAILKGQIRFSSNTAYLQFKKGQLLAAGTDSIRPQQSILMTALQQFGCCQKANTANTGGLSKYVPYTQP